MLGFTNRRGSGATAVSLGLPVVALLACAPVAPPTTGVAIQSPPTLIEDCREYPAPRNVDQLDEVSRTYLGHPGFLGGDGAIDAVLGDGRRLVVFGDTLRQASYPGGGFARNSMMILGADTACVISGVSGGAVIPDREDGIGYWPMSIEVRANEKGDDVVLMSQRMATTATDDLGFVILGSSIVRMRIPHGGVPSLPRVVDLGPDDPSREVILWGAAIGHEQRQSSVEWHYIYGTAAVPGVFGRSLRVARSRWANLSEPGAWQYWDGAEWQSDPDRAQEVIPAEGGVAQVLSVFEQSDRWFAVSTRDGDLGDEVAVWSAPTPNGPFTADTADTASLTLAAERFDGALTYLVLAHPDLFDQPGSVVISYSRGATDWDTLVAEPLLYRPGFERIDLPISE